jgi:hypothetical protein
MSQKVQVLILDDLHLAADPESDVPAQETVSFSLDGIDYEIDLTARNATVFREELEPYRSAARKISGQKQRRRPAPASPDLKIRAWARDRGYKINDRGRIPGPIRKDYEAAHKHE